jgi:cell division protein ZapE
VVAGLSNQEDLATPVTPTELVPPPRFQTTTFATYNTQSEQQAAAVSKIKAFISAPRRRWPWQRRQPPGLYLDGDFGVGKTHLLASCWHAHAGDLKRYLSFAEAMSLCTQHGAQGAAQRLAGDLVCFDEFELDDPSYTRLSDLLLAELVAGGARLIVTSNTIPGELGVGRMFVDRFRAQLERVADYFHDVHVSGSDFRQRRAHEAPAPVPAGSAEFTLPELDKVLLNLPVINYRRLVASWTGLTLHDVTQFDDQLSALRFVHVIDRVYEWQLPVHASWQTPLSELFHPSFRDLGYRKKYARCLSRLAELTGTPLHS